MAVVATEPPPWTDLAVRFAALAGATPPDRPATVPGAFGAGSPELFVAVAVLVAGLAYLAVRRLRGEDSRRRGGIAAGDRKEGRIAPGAESGLGGSTRFRDGGVTDEEYVLRKLETHDARMKQSEIVEATGWSKAKVSRVLSRLEAAGYVRKSKRGRENVIVLDDGD